MTFRTRLLLIFTLAVVASVGLVGWLVSRTTRDAFERVESQRVDALVALMLAASTYPGQVIDADHWRRVQGNASSDQIVAGANVQNWDPSIKALTAFPDVLAERHPGKEQSWQVHTESSCLQHERVDVEVDGQDYAFIVDINGPAIHPGNPRSPLPVRLPSTAAAENQ